MTIFSNITSDIRHARVTHKQLVTSQVLSAVYAKQNVSNGSVDVI